MSHPAVTRSLCTRRRSSNVGATSHYQSTGLPSLGTFHVFPHSTPRTSDVDLSIRRTTAVVGFFAAQSVRLFQCGLEFREQHREGRDALEEIRNWQRIRGHGSTERGGRSLHRSHRIFPSTILLRVALLDVLVPRRLWRGLLSRRDECPSRSPSLVVERLPSPPEMASARFGCAGHGCKGELRLQVAD